MVGDELGGKTPYAFFVQICRDELMKTFPEQNVPYQEFARKCAGRWRTMTEREKRWFNQLAAKDAEDQEKRKIEMNQPTNKDQEKRRIENNRLTSKDSKDREKRRVDNNQLAAKHQERRRIETNQAASKDEEKRGVEINHLDAKDMEKRRVDNNKRAMENNRKIIEQMQMKSNINNAQNAVKIAKTNEMVRISDMKAKRKEKDPSVPKRPLSAFFWFCEAKRPRLRAENPRLKMGEVSRELTKMWMASDRTVKAEFEEEAERDRQRYDREIEVYNVGRKKNYHHRKPLKEENK